MAGLSDANLFFLSMAPTRGRGARHRITRWLPTYTLGSILLKGQYRFLIPVWFLFIKL
jgi:hypothetical protein